MGVCFQILIDHFTARSPVASSVKDKWVEYEDGGREARGREAVALKHEVQMPHLSM